MNDEVKAPEVSETENFVTTSTDVPVVEEPASQDEATPSTEEQSGEVVNSSDKAAGDDATAEINEEPKAKSKSQKRIDRLVREREEAKRESERLQAELDKRNEKPEASTSEPQEGDFDTYDEYLEAVDKFDNSSDSPGTTEKPAEQSAAEEQQASTLSDSQKTAMEVLREKTSSAADTYSDFNEVALANDVVITGDMIEGLAECEDPAKIMMHLGQNKELSAEIANKSPAQQMVALARLDMTVKVTPIKPANNSKTADPISPVKGSDVHETPLAEQSFSDYEKTMNERERKGGSSDW